ncbi:hypothetical protein Pint_07599 [Pistacia integerrima]|uniref:Uncharacterized protein n=1 Tax=Pistacia integerrima TaxID=434235 RepID=A0ACC0XUM0_9ROSI|nr:hypothetical protein Pint_07599 [Pistacia integerrima]
MLVSAVLGTGLAKALTYEEALQQSTSSSTFDVDVSHDDRQDTGDQIPNTWDKVGRDEEWVEEVKMGVPDSLDIRPPPEFRQVGSPDVRGLGKKHVSIVYKGEDKPGFLKKLSLKLKDT